MEEEVVLTTEERTIDLCKMRVERRGEEERTKHRANTIISQLQTGLTTLYTSFTKFYSIYNFVGYFKR